MRVVVLRLGHRIPRDPRLTTHVCLTARALGADGVIVSDVIDTGIERTINEVSDRFGGSFFVRSGNPHMRVIRDWISQGGTVVHLTAYGIPIADVIDDIRKTASDKLVVVGAEKVPAEIYHAATWNVAVTNQPMSEVSALAIFLDWLFKHREFETEFRGAKMRIVPSERGKKIVKASGAGSG
jgi:tRNA (cytidine56-2'-O)-methyltransferase